MDDRPITLAEVRAARRRMFFADAAEEERDRARTDARISRKRTGHALDLPAKPRTNGVKERALPFAWADDLIGKDSGLHEIVEGVLTAGGMSVFYGEPNSGKSYIALHLAICMALGLDWLGRRVERGAAIYVAAEGSASIRDRLTAYAMHHKVKKLPGLGIVTTALNLLDPSVDVEAFVELVQAKALEIGGPVRLIVIDTLARSMASGDENSSQDMGRLVRAGDRIREATGAHVLWVHHSGKDALRGARGSSVLKAAVDTEVQVVADESAHVHVATVTKQRDLAGKRDALTARFVSVPIRTNQWGNPVMACIVEHATDYVPATKAPSGKLQQAILRLLGIEPVKKADLVAKLEDLAFSRTACYRTISGLIENGKIDVGMDSKLRLIEAQQ